MQIIAISYNKIYQDALKCIKINVSTNSFNKIECNGYNNW